MELSTERHSVAPERSASREAALAALGRALRAVGYRFETVTPATHARVVARESMRMARDLRGVFGWSLPFARALLSADVLEPLEAADAVERLEDGRLRARVRFSSLGDHLFVHSSHPTDERDAVFFGPDTLRFARLLEQTRRACGRVLDLGCGTGAGGISLESSARELVLSDISPRALSLARANVAIAGITHARVVHSDLFARIGGRFDLIVANPPYLVDDAKRAYRDGGGALGIELAQRIACESIPRLEPGGRLVMYTGVPILDGRDPLRGSIEPLLLRAGAHLTYEELDPDVFGEELERPTYARADRIAVVAVIAELR